MVLYLAISLDVDKSCIAIFDALKKFKEPLFYTAFSYTGLQFKNHVLYILIQHKDITTYA